MVDKVAARSEAPNTGTVGYLQTYSHNFWLWDFWGANYLIYVSTKASHDGTLNTAGAKMV